MKSKLKDVLWYLFVFAVAIFISNFVIFRYEVTGTSMNPTLTDGQKGFALRTNLNLKNIKRFDIVVLDAGSRYIVKRVIGLPNEKLEYKDNKLYIDGVQVDEPYLKNVSTEDFIVEKLNGYYCLGDNRQQSADSRKYGAFNSEQIIAVLIDKGIDKDGN